MRGMVREAGFGLLNGGVGEPRTTAQAEIGLADLCKTLGNRPEGGPGNRADCRLKLCRYRFRDLWLTVGYFAGSVSWLTVKSLYLPQYVAKVPARKTMQVSVSDLYVVILGKAENA